MKYMRVFGTKGRLCVLSDTNRPFVPMAAELVALNWWWRSDSRGGRKQNLEEAEKVEAVEEHRDVLLGVSS